MLRNHLPAKPNITNQKAISEGAVTPEELVFLFIGKEMKDINKLKDYRKKYKRYYNIDFASDFVVHHLDFDRNNNDISNLLLLPKELHHRYHFYLQALNNSDWKSGVFEIPTRIDMYRFQYYSEDILYGFLETLKECQKWVAYKEHLNFKKYNMNNIRGE